MWQQISQSWVCWSILFVAVMSYHKLFRLVIQSRQTSVNQSQQKEAALTQAEFTQDWQLCMVLLSALPLIGLFGTITGLQGSFNALFGEHTNSVEVTNGIASALLSTQLGLAMAVPGWIIAELARQRFARHVVYAQIVLQARMNKGERHA